MQIFFSNENSRFFFFFSFSGNETKQNKHKTCYTGFLFSLLVVNFSKSRMPSIIQPTIHPSNHPSKTLTQCVGFDDGYHFVVLEISFFFFCMQNVRIEYKREIAFFFHPDEYASIFLMNLYFFVFPKKKNSLITQTQWSKEFKQR